MVGRAPPCSGNGQLKGGQRASVPAPSHHHVADILQGQPGSHTLLQQLGPQPEGEEAGGAHGRAEHGVQHAGVLQAVQGLDVAEAQSGDLGQE